MASIANVSGYQHPKCYANALNDCSKKISREHYLSAALLRRLESLGGFQVSGLAWQDPHTPSSLPSAALCAKVLCEHHNSILHCLDDTALAFVNTIYKIDQSDPPIEFETSVSGSDLERWMLKLLIGSTASKNVDAVVQENWIKALFRRDHWKTGTGLYFALNAKVYHTNGLLMDFLKGPDRTLLAARIFLQGMPITLCLGKPDNPEGFGMWRPRGLRFIRNNTESRLKFEWDETFDENAVVIRRTDTYDGDPPIW